MIRAVSKFVRDRAGATVLEFAIMGPVVLVVLFGLFDVAIALFVKSNFTHAVNAAAREVYIDPDRTDSEIKKSIDDALTRFSNQVTTDVSTASQGALEFKVIAVTMVYNYKTPFLNLAPVVLEGESRAPILDYSID